MINLLVYAMLIKNSMEFNDGNGFTFHYPETLLVMKSST
jgi:hypothetical protein